MPDCVEQSEAWEKRPLRNVMSAYSFHLCQVFRACSRSFVSQVAEIVEVAAATARLCSFLVSMSTVMSRI